MSRVIRQSNFSKGLDAATQVFAKAQQAIVQRISNLIYTVRGALQTVPGTKVLAAYNGSVNPSSGIIVLGMSAFPSSPLALPSIILLVNNPNHIATPGIPTLTAATGGTLTPGLTYAYRIVASDPSGLHTTAAGPEQTITLGAGKTAVQISWTAVPGAAFYQVWGRSPGAENRYGSPIITADTNVVPTSFTDDGTTLTVVGTLPVVDNGTTKTSLVNINPVWDGSTPISYTSGNMFSSYPLIQVLSPFQQTPGRWGENLLAPNSGFTSGSPNTGVFGPGQPGPLPQFIPFGSWNGTNVISMMILCLGNSYPPQFFSEFSTQSDPITNTFTISYPQWVASSPYQVGVVVVPNPSNGHVYQCIQAGISGASQPTFPTTAANTVKDGQAIWQEIGSDTANSAPPGMAHGALYGDALWAWNTYPSNTIDGLNGPSALRMSDVGNINSWNPLNTVFIDRDDNQEGMGIAPIGVAETGIIPTGVLVAFKNYSTYVINGLMGASDFSINKAKTDLGCIAPRSIQYVAELGSLIRLTHRGFATFDGINDTIISDVIEPYIIPQIQQPSDISPIDWFYAWFSKATVSTNPRAYICLCPTIASETVQQGGLLTRAFIYDISLKAWAIADLAIPIASIYSLPLNYSLPVTYLGAYNDSTIRRWMANDPDWEENGLITWKFRTPDVFGSSEASKIYLDKLLLRGLGLGVPQSVTINLNESETTDANRAPAAVPFSTSPATIGTRFQSIAQIGQTSMNANADITGSGQIEIDSVEWVVDDRPQGTPMRFS